MELGRSSDYVLFCGRLDRAIQARSGPVGEGVQKGVYGRVEIAEPDSETLKAFGNTVLAQGHDEEHNKVGQEANGEADHDQ